MEWIVRITRIIGFQNHMARVPNCIQHWSETAQLQRHPMTDLKEIHNQTLGKHPTHDKENTKRPRRDSTPKERPQRCTRKQQQQEAEQLYAMCVVFLWRRGGGAQFALNGLRECTKCIFYSYEYFFIRSGRKWGNILQVAALKLLLLTLFYIWHREATSHQILNDEQCPALLLTQRRKPIIDQF